MGLPKVRCFSLSLLLVPIAWGQPADPAIDLLWAVKVPMRDGVKLNATVLKPHDMTGPLPVVFTLTPYIADTYYDRASYFARNGYVFALVDVRGRGSSEGSFDPFAQEGRDGYDAVEWLARQPWSNGKVAMWGGSYAGFDQWATAKEFPPHLATIVPAAAVAPGVDFPFLKNIFYSYDIQWLTYTGGVTGNQKLFGDADFWAGKFREVYRKHLPFTDLDKVAGNASIYFQKWLEHPAPDSYLDDMIPSADQFRRVSIPMLTITGDYDADQPGAMFYYRGHMENAPAEARARHYLIIGPWDHAATRTPKREVGGLKFGEASVLDLNKLHKQWYDWTMKDGPQPEFLKKRVAYYVAGAEEWKYGDSLEVIGGAARTLYLDSGGVASDAFHSGELRSTKPTGAAADRYIYDPLDTRAGEAEPNDPDANSLSTQFYALNLFGNGLVYHSEPFPEDTEITGNVRFMAWISMDVPDTDFNVALYEIAADGSSALLTSDVLRARYRESPRREKLVPSGEIVRYEFNGFPWFSRRVAKGSRLRLVVQSSNTIQMEKNYNSGRVVAKESGEDARTAHIVLYHEAAHASMLEIPVARK